MSEGCLVVQQPSTFFVRSGSLHISKKAQKIQQSAQHFLKKSASTPLPTLLVAYRWWAQLQSNEGKIAFFVKQ